jgi:predicted nucleic acid-binding protein
MHWVADTGPLLHLAEAGAAALLPRLGQLSIPPAVAQELYRYRLPVATAIQATEVPLDLPAAAVATQWCTTGLIQRGEAEAIALTRQVRADILLTDDAAARVFATALGIEVRGSLGVILWLAAQRHLSVVDAGRLLDALERTSLWLSPRVKTEARQALAKMHPEG